MTCTGVGCKGSAKPKQIWKPKQPKNSGRSAPAAPPRAPAPTGPWVCFSPPQGQWRAPYATPNAPGILGPRLQAYNIVSAPLYQSAPPTSTAPSWDNAGLIAALNNLGLQQGSWVMDTGATSHMTNSDGNLMTTTPLSAPHFVTVGNGSAVPISSSGHTLFRSPSGQIFKLNHVLLVPHLIRNFLPIRQFTRDNYCSVEFDAFGFSVKDLKTRRVIVRCNSDGDLYTFPGSSTFRVPPTTMLAAIAADLWHQRLGHLGQDAMSGLQRLSLIKCNRPRSTSMATPPAATPLQSSRRLDFLFIDTLESRPPRAAPASPPAAAGNLGSPLPPPAAATMATAPPPRTPVARASPPTTAMVPPPRTTRTGRVIRPPPRLNLSAVVSTVPPAPTMFRQAMQDPLWRAAMANEHQALVDNKTWSLVPRPPHANVVTGKWIYRHKFHSDGRLARHKARWVVRGYSQRPGVDYDETFSPVVKPATIRIVLTIAVSHSWPIRQLDVKNAFLNGTLDEEVYCQQPPGFVDEHHPDHVCRLHKSLYGLKQAPRAWYQRSATYLSSLGFTASVTDTSLFVLKSGADMAYLLLYVDDIIITASSTTFLHHLLDRLHNEFAKTDLGDLHFFLGIAVSHFSDGLFLSHRQYAADLLQRSGMSDCHPASTPVDTQSKLSATEGDLVPDGTKYRSLTGALQYLTLTRPDISYAVQQVCLHMHAPRMPHLALVKRVLRYIRGTLDFGLHPCFFLDSSHSLL
ncbi:uncharacterized protein [Lolium perenne]|uniref:uncharacterized protein n=1 Tax=Lolium perenne TaxID=4522 RepID=UPI003A99DD54